MINFQFSNDLTKTVTDVDQINGLYLTHFSCRMVGKLQTVTMNSMSRPDQTFLHKVAEL